MMTRDWSPAALLLGGVALTVAMSLAAHASVPKKQPLGRYAELWTKSPFTVPPVVVGPDIVEENPLEDYTLAGVCEMKGGWFVVLMNKKKREERIRIKPGEKNEQGFKVSKVESGSKYLETKVEIQLPGGKTGWVEYDEKFIVLKRATPRAPQGKPQPGQPPVPGQPTPPVPRQATQPSPVPQPSSSGSNRPARVRRVPTPPSR